jgi:hypothetical protein
VFLILPKETRDQLPDSGRLSGSTDSFLKSKGVHESDFCETKPRQGELSNPHSGDYMMLHNASVDRNNNKLAWFSVGVFQALALRP